MMKHLRTFGAAAAALAASVALISAPALAQQGRPGNTNDLAGAPGYRDYDRDRNYDRDRDGNWGGDWNNNDRRRAPDFQWAQEQCSKAGIQEAWRRNYYSAQYNDGPKLVDGRRGWEMVGRMRLHDRRGHSYVNTVCYIGGGRGRGNDVQIDFR